MVTSETCNNYHYDKIIINNTVPTSHASQAFSKQDFNGGISSLMARIVGSSETFVVSNIKSSLLQRFAHKSVVVNVGGKTIGIVGYVSRYWNVSRNGDVPRDF